jgi:hypothetical protein
LSQKGKTDIVIGGLNGEQRFFLAFAQRWRKKQSEAALRRQIAADSHSPGEYRSDTVRNAEAWYKVYKIALSREWRFVAHHQVRRDLRKEPSRAFDLALFDLPQIHRRETTFGLGDEIDVLDGALHEGDRGHACCDTMAACKPW